MAKKKKKSKSKGSHSNRNKLRDAASVHEKNDDPVAVVSSAFFVDSILREGDRVVLRNLQSREFNEKLGTVKRLCRVEPVQETSRFGILVDGSSEPVAIQAKNIAPIFQINERVTINGLTDKSLNGDFGTIVQVPPNVSNSDCRYKVKMANFDKQKDTVWIPAENLFRTERTSTKEQAQKREAMINISEMPTEECMDAFQLSMVRQMMTFLSPSDQVKMFGRTISPMPNFYEEVLQANGFPHGVDRDWAATHLHQAFEQASHLPHMMELMYRNGDKDAVSPHDIVKRLGTNNTQKLHWYFHASCAGEIYPNAGQEGIYCPYVRHSYSNQAYRQERLQCGTTHVAVGFVDLGILLTMDLVVEPPVMGKAGPLHFLGVEQSSYSVAKALLIWEMLKCFPQQKTKSLEDTHLQRYAWSILQVWFSTTWGPGTEEIVRRCLSNLCESQRYHPEVRAILDHWNNAASLSLYSARDQTINATTSKRTYIGNFLRRRDRLAMAKYELSRDFGLSGEKPVCGNLIMFDCPDGTAPLEKDETVFSALNVTEIMKVMQADSSLSIIDAAEKYSHSKLLELALKVQSNFISIELICDRVENVLEDLASRKPWTMSWSNLSDYFKYDEFHAMARKCSIHGDTVHYGYSMNWPSQVFGVQITDYARLPVHNRTREWKKILDQGTRMVELAYSIYGWSDFLRTPPPTNPINTSANFVLEPLHYRAWIDHFFVQSMAGEGGPCQVGHVEHAGGRSPFSPTGCSTIYFTWTYDPDIKFQSLGFGL